MQVKKNIFEIMVSFPYISIYVHIHAHKCIKVNIKTEYLLFLVTEVATQSWITLCETESLC